MDTEKVGFDYQLSIITMGGYLSNGLISIECYEITSKYKKYPLKHVFSTISLLSIN